MKLDVCKFGRQSSWNSIGREACEKKNLVQRKPTQMWSPIHLAEEFRACLSKLKY